MCKYLNIKGVHVNNWTTRANDPKPRNDSIEHGHVHRDLALQINTRAKSASSILGRRYFERAQQQLIDTDILRGIRLGFQQDKESKENIKKVSQLRKYELNNKLNTPLCSKIRALSRNKISPGNSSFATTVMGISFKKKIIKTPCWDESVKIIPCSDILGGCAVKGEKLEKHKLVLDIEERAKSAPAHMRYCYDLQNLKTTPRKHTPLFWNVRNVHTRKLQGRLNTTGNYHADSVVGCRRPMLRSLLHDTNGLSKHSADCPYKCKSCFKACLVSDDYMQKYGKTTQKKN